MIDHYGPVSELAVREVPRPQAGEDQVIVEIEAAAVNPSDVASAEGRFPNTPLPRILGRDFAGRVVEGPDDVLNYDVWGTGGDLGILRDGTHAEYVVLPREAVSLRPPNLSVEEAASVGVAYVTAWSALFDLGHLEPGECVIVSGAAGAVGDAAVQLASTCRAHVVALVKDEQEESSVDREKVEGIARSDLNNLTHVVADATDGKGCNLALNGVGGAIFQPMQDSLADGGRMVVYSSAGGREVTLDLLNLYRRRLTLTGLNTGALDATECARIMDQLTPLFKTGAIRPPRIAERHPLSNAAEAYAHVERGTIGKVVLVPDRVWHP